MRCLVSCLVFVLVGARPAAACSAFRLAGKARVVVGKSYDWFYGHGHGALYVNPRGIARTTLRLDDTPDPASWTSRFGSVTMTQFGRGVPISGINERGLVVELLQLHNVTYNADRADLPYVNESQWAQYQLDRFATVAEVIANIDTLRIEQAYTGIHYFVADRSGAAATVEFRDGRPVIHTVDTLPVPVLTNSYYDHLIEYARQHPETPPEALHRRRSEVRFMRARAFTERVPTTPDAELPDLAWSILDAVRLNGTAPDALFGPSQWNIVYDVTAGEFWFRTRGARSIKHLALADVDLNEGAPELMVDMNESFAGEIAPRLRPYTFEENAALVRRNMFLFTISLQRAKVAPAVAYGRVCTEKFTDARAK